MTRRLKVGTVARKVTPPTTQPCTEPVVYGTNILRDPGFELHVANTSRSGEVPMESSGVSKVHPVWSDGSLDAGATSGWRLSNGGPQTDWVVSTDDPRTGTYHLQSAPTESSGVDLDVPFAGVFPTNFHVCVEKAGSFIPTCRVEPGDYVRVSFWIKDTSGVGVSGTRIWFFDEAGSSLFTSTLEENSVSTSYTQVTRDAFAPASSYYFAVQVDVSDDGIQTIPDGSYFRIDDFVLQVSK